VATSAATAGSAATCGAGGKIQGFTVPSAAQSPTVAAICKNGSIRTAVAPFAPHGFQDASGHFRGPGVEIVVPELAKLLGVKEQVVPVSWDTVVVGLQTKKYDMITTGLTYTAERDKVIDFVIDTIGGTCYVVKKDSSIKSLAQLNSPDVKIGVYTGTSWETDLPKVFPKAQFDSAVEGQGGGYRAADVLAGRIDAAPIDNVTAFAFAANYKDLRVVPSPNQCLTNPKPVDKLGFGVPQGDPKFKALVQAVVKKEQKKINAMIRKYASPKYINVGHE
jgi:ABC-type amino acid transport substrate-binding protein